MGTMINRRRIMGGNKLPYDAEIEYLESSGTQCINTGIIPNSTTVWTLEISMANSGNIQQNGVFQAANIRFSIGANPKYIQFGTNALFTSNIVNDGGRHTYTIDVPNRSYYRDGNKVGTFTSFPSITVPMYIMARHIQTVYTGIDGYIIGRFYHTSIIQNGNLVLDLIPVRVGNVGYLYDKVSKQLFGNAGTGDFILGPDKDSAVIITQQQQYEMYGE